jgi:hypothetical protein
MKDKYIPVLFICQCRSLKDRLDILYCGGKLGSLFHSNSRKRLRVCARDKKRWKEGKVTLQRFGQHQLKGL